MREDNRWNKASETTGREKDPETFRKVEKNRVMLTQISVCGWNRKLSSSYIVCLFPLCEAEDEIIYRSEKEVEKVGT